MTTRHIIETIGPEAISTRLGVTLHSVRHAKTTGRFPASWFNELDKMCREAGVNCDRANFNFKSPSADSAPSAEAS